MNRRRWITLILFSLFALTAAADGVGIDPHGGRPKPLACSSESGGAMDWRR